MWFWFTAMLAFTYCEIIDPVRPNFGKRYLHVAHEAEELQEQLEENFKCLLREEQNEHSGVPKS